MIENESRFLQKVHLEMRVVFLVLKVMDQICHTFEDSQI